MTGQTGIAINERHEAARTLVTAAHNFLLEYLEYDNWHEGRHELAAAAASVVFSASYVSSEEKHDLLHDVHEKLKGKTWRNKSDYYPPEKPVLTIVKRE